MAVQERMRHMVEMEMIRLKMMVTPEGVGDSNKVYGGSGDDNIDLGFDAYTATIFTMFMVKMALITSRWYPMLT